MTKIAFLGLGIMGSRMAANLHAAGHELTVWNRTAATARQFADEHDGARPAETPARAAAGAELVFTIVVDGPQVREVLLGDDGAATGADPGTRFVDCSTIGPAETLTIDAALAERGFALVDAPVTGGKAGAQDGTLTFMVGATGEELTAISPALEAMGRLVVHCGDHGQGQLVKVIANTVGAANTVIAGQALLLAKRAGADLDALVEAMDNGTAASRSLTINGTQMREHDYTPRFKLAHMLKDVSLCLGESERLGVPFPSGAFTQQMLVAGVGRGRGDEDTSAVIEALQALADVQL
jgi:3-hydroxyisobutyrate dehydrogenase-like beta-hydroxyacid dehydrogenase